MKRLLRLLPGAGKLLLFDSWQGIPCDWRLSPRRTEPRGSWTFARPEISDPRAVFVDGWFENTLPYSFGGQIGLLNIDCDVYSSTRDVLWGCNDWIDSGTAIIFDELIGYQNYKAHEYRALREWLRGTNRTMRWIAKESFAAVGVVQ
jgi:hypothetical protein